MQIFENLTDWQTVRDAIDPKSQLGFVPTMGNLHHGHLSLVETSQKNNQQTIVSLFINPTQFNNPEDFKLYPKTLDQDLQLLKNAGVNYCLIPKQEELYADHYRYQIQETELSQVLEGACRPGHFTGVLTVVMKLLQCTRPHHCYFGEKDYQQYLLIRDMAAAFFLQTKIVACPTIREPSGLAFSSRNNRLSADERVEAEHFASIFHQRGTSCEAIQKELEQRGIKVDYVQEHWNRRFAAVFVGAVRLIDNYAI